VGRVFKNIFGLSYLIKPIKPFNSMSNLGTELPFNIEITTYSKDYPSKKTYYTEGRGRKKRR